MSGKVLGSWITAGGFYKYIKRHKLLIISFLYGNDKAWEFATLQKISTNKAT